VACTGGTTCNVDTNTCQATSPGVPTAGAACTPGFLCVAGYYCKATTNDSGVCTVEAKENEGCADSQCTASTYCGSDDVCHQPPGPGQPCASNAVRSGICGGETICLMTDANPGGTCVATPKAGEPCILSPGDDNPNSGSCGNNGVLHCDHTTTPPICKLPGKAGDSCRTIQDCGAFANCECPDPAVDCTERHCVELRFGNQSCTDPYSRCHPAFTCTAGVCQPGAVRGNFTSSCGP